MSLQDPQQSEIARLRKIVDTASRVIPQYREQNAALKQLVNQNNTNIKNLQEELKLLEAKNLSITDQLSKNQKRQNVLSIVSAILALALVILFFTHTSFVRDNKARIEEQATAFQSNSSTIDAQSNRISNPTSSSKKSSSYSAYASSKASTTEKNYVWIPHSGKRYHDKKTCSGMKDPTLVTISEAKRLGFTPCGTCDPPR